MTIPDWRIRIVRRMLEAGGCSNAELRKESGVSLGKISEIRKGMGLGGKTPLSAAKVRAVKSDISLGYTIQTTAMRNNISMPTVGKIKKGDYDHVLRRNNSSASRTKA